MEKIRNAGLIRLLIEVVLIISAAELLIMVIMPSLDIPDTGLTAALIDTLLLSLITTPLLLWRLRVHTSTELASDTQLPTSAANATATRSAAIIAIGVFLLGSGLSLLTAYFMLQEVRQEAAWRFSKEVELIDLDVQTRFDKPVLALKGLIGIHAADQAFSRPKFRAYWQARGFEKDYPGVRGFGFIQHVPTAALSRFIAAERRDHAPDFRIKRQSDLNDHYVITLIEPVEINREAVGLDIGFETVRRSGAEQAARTGAPTLTGVITLVQDGRKGPGFLLLLPVYRPHADLGTEASRLAHLVGFVYSPIVAQELLQGTVPMMNGQTDFELYAAPQASALVRVFASKKEASPQEEASNHKEKHAPRFVATRPMTIGGQDFSLQVHSTPEFEAAINAGPALLVGSGGTLLSALIALTLWLLAVGRVRAEARAHELTGDLQRLAMVAERTSNSVIIADANNRITWVNQAFSRLSGYSLEEARGHEARELRGEIQDKETLARIWDAVKKGENLRIETLNQSRDGQLYWLDLDLQNLRDEHGAYTGYVAVERDITEAKQAQEHARANAERLNVALRQAEALMGTINTHAIVSEADRAGRITHVNDAFCSISGFSREELLGRDHRIVNSGVQTREFWIDMWRTIAKGKPWRGLVCNRAKNGSMYWVDSIIAPFRDAEGKVEKYVSIRFDVTQARQSQLELAQERLHLRNILEGTNVGTWEVNLITGESRIDARWAAMLGYSPEELLPYEEAKWRVMVHPADLERSQDLLIQHMKGETNFYEAERRMRHKDGHWVWILARGRVSSRLPDGRAEWMSGTHMDVSQRKLAELEAKRADEMLRQAINTLDEAFVIYDEKDCLLMCNQRYRDTYPIAAQVMSPGTSFEEIIRYGAERGEYAQAVGRVDEWVAERLRQYHSANTDLVQELGNGRYLRIVERKTTDGFTVGFRIDISNLVRARLEAETASRSKSQFLANMSHEIRTPMNAILGMLNLLQSTELNTRQRDYVRKTEGAAKSLLDLLNDILDFSKVEAGKMTLELAPFRIDHLMRDLSVILSSNTGSKPLEVLFDIDPRLPVHLLGDSLRLRQVLINLGGNAIKFTERGEILIRLKVLALQTGKVTLEVSVRDTGIGIAPENIARIFDGFSQAEASTTRRFGGTGLGLAISRRLIVLMGGELELDSELGKGSTFHFSIPLDVDNSATSEVDQPAQNDLRDLQILIIDDNPVAREVLLGMVQPMGWQAEAVEGGEQALQRIRARLAAGLRPFDAVFVDWQMPGMDGWETSQEIRKLLEQEGSPILLMVTAHGREMLAQRSEKDQSLLDGFLVKPVTASMLLDAIVDVQLAAKGQTRPQAPVAVQWRRLLGMRVLLVEDNKMNQEVATELLEREGAEVALADNGALGVEAVAAAQPPYDVVLMDIQMPVMDGYTAARKIRQELGLTDLPMIAMTANAMESDRQEALAAGMNAHVGKPFDLDQLVSTMLEHSGYRVPAGSATDTRAIASMPPSATEARLPMPSSTGEIDIQTALKRLAGDISILTRVLKSFALQLPQQATELADHLIQGRLEDARRQMHTLKGSAATVGANRLSAAAAEAEDRLRSGIPPSEEEAHTMVSTLQVRVEAAICELTPLLGQLLADAQATDDLAQASPLDRHALQADLVSLQELLANSDLASLDTYQHLRSRHGAALGDELDSLDEAMAALDFSQAHALCVTLNQKYTA